MEVLTNENFRDKKLLTHQDPCTISIQGISQAVPNQRHGLDLVHVGVVEEIRITKTLKR